MNTIFKRVLYCLLLFTMVAFGVVWRHSYTDYSQFDDWESEYGRVGRAEPQERSPILINSYMNSGSRFTANLFGFRSDAFYFYEPLWRFSTYDYYKSPNLCCNSVESFDCKNITVQELNTITIPKTGEKIQIVSNISREISPVDLLTEVLDEIYNCNFSRLENTIEHKVQDDPNLSGPSWDKYRLCLYKDKLPKTTCVTIAEHSFRSARFTVTRVLRLTTGSLELLLRKQPNLKIIHLFRDPRAIMNSRTESIQYLVRNYETNMKVLCRKMMWDITEGQYLLAKYPNNFKFVFYDDVKANTSQKVKELYKFVGMPYTNTSTLVYNKVLTNKPKSKAKELVTARQKDNAQWWRKYLPFSRYQEVHKHCKDVILTFNLTVFRNEQELRDLSIPSFHLPSMFSIM